MKIRSANEFENYINDICFRVSKETHVTDSNMLVEFRKYLKDYVLEKILSNNAVIDDISTGIKIALLGSGISYGNTLGDEINPEPIENDEDLYNYAEREVARLAKEEDGGYYFFKINDFIEDSRGRSYQELVVPLVEYKLGFNDRYIGYIIEDDEEVDIPIYFVQGELLGCYLSMKKKMDENGFDSSNSLTCEILDEVFNNNGHYSLPEKRALIGMVYVDTMITNGFDVDDDKIGVTKLNLEAACCDGNEVFKRYKDEFDEEIKTYRGNGKVNKRPLPKGGQND